MVLGGFLSGVFLVVVFFGFVFLVFLKPFAFSIFKILSGNNLTFLLLCPMCIFFQKEVNTSEHTSIV